MHVQLPDWEQGTLAKLELLIGELTGLTQI